MLPITNIKPCFGAMFTFPVAKLGKAKSRAVEAILNTHCVAGTMLDPRRFDCVSDERYGPDAALRGTTGTTTAYAILRGVTEKGRNRAIRKKLTKLGLQEGRDYLVSPKEMHPPASQLDSYEARQLGIRAPNSFVVLDTVGKLIGKARPQDSQKLCDSINDALDAAASARHSGMLEVSRLANRLDPYAAKQAGVTLEKASRENRFGFSELMYAAQRLADRLSPKKAERLRKLIKEVYDANEKALASGVLKAMGLAKGLVPYELKELLRTNAALEKALDTSGLVEAAVTVLGPVHPDKPQGLQRILLRPAQKS